MLVGTKHYVCEVCTKRIPLEQSSNTDRVQLEKLGQR